VEVDQPAVAGRSAGVQIIDLQVGYADFPLAGKALAGRLYLAADVTVAMAGERDPDVTRRVISPVSPGFARMITRASPLNAARWVD
jgi:hypothetical protein